MQYFTRGKPKTTKVVPSTVNINNFKEITPLDNEEVRNYAYEITRSFRNYLSYPVVLMDRNNLQVKIPSQRRSRSTERDLFVDVMIRYDVDTVFDYSHVLDRVDESSPYELQLIKRILNNNRTSVRYGKNFIQYSYRIDDHLITSHNGGVYVNQLDMVVCKEDSGPYLVHPRSEVGHALLYQFTPLAFTYSIVINDPDSLFGDRYLNINGEVYQVRRTVDFATPPGVYVYTDKMVRYDFHEADEKLKLFTSESIARYLGTPEEHIKAQIDQETLRYRKEVLEKEREMTNLKHDLAKKEMKRKRKYEEQLNDLKQRESELKRLELEYKRLSSIESQRLSNLKHDLEMKSLDRKDTSEFIKWLPAIIGSIAALYAALN